MAVLMETVGERSKIKNVDDAKMVITFDYLAASLRSGSF